MACLPKSSAIPFFFFLRVLATEGKAHDRSPLLRFIYILIRILKHSKYTSEALFILQHHACTYGPQEGGEHPACCRCSISCSRYIFSHWISFIGTLRTNSRIDNDQEFLLDAADVASADAEVMVPEAQDEGDNMAIDEEGRPRFAPSKDIVRRNAA